MTKKYKEYEITFNKLMSKLGADAKKCYIYNMYYASCVFKVLTKREVNQVGLLRYFCNTYIRKSKELTFNSIALGYLNNYFGNQMKITDDMCYKLIMDRYKVPETCKDSFEAIDYVINNYESKYDKIFEEFVLNSKYA